MSTRVVENAAEWVGQVVSIRGAVGGYINLANVEHNANVVVGALPLLGFLVEGAPDETPGVVTFRVSGTDDLYLTNIMYGDQLRQDVAATLASIPGILADNIGMVVDYAVGRPTNASNFEGAGFNYSPMVVQRGPPNKLQMFRLESSPGHPNGLCVKSLFGTYWRSQHWNHTVSQSPNALRDETWYFREV